MTKSTMNEINLADEIAVLHAELCSALADPRRILIIYILASRPRTVNDLADEIGVSQPTASRHLKTLREAGIVRATRQGACIEYCVTDSRLIEALDILRAVLRERLKYRASLVENDSPANEH